jgi:hypothetical protein
LMRPTYHQPELLNHTNMITLDSSIRPMISQKYLINPRP